MAVGCVPESEIAQRHWGFPIHHLTLHTSSIPTIQTYTIIMKRALLFLAVATLHAEDPKPSFKTVTAETHGEVMVERYRASEGTEQIWLVSTADPAKRHLLYTHHRQAAIIFSADHAWLVINDHAGSSGSSLLLYRRKEPLIYEQAADLTDAAWQFFDTRNGLKVPAKGKTEDMQRIDRQHGLEANPFDHRYIDAVCWAGVDPPTLLICLSGHEAARSRASAWYCLYDVLTKSFTTDFDAYNKKNTKLEAK
jgi:hypothetical protein